MLTTARFRRNGGFSMVEVLVTTLIVAFGMLGLAGLQMKLQTSEMESYQRAQALVLLGDMSERLMANNANAASYVSTSVFGTGHSDPTSCASLTAGSADRDLCEWSYELKGSAETKSGGGNIGAMIGARGCITQVQAPNPASGVCQPGIYEIDVAWQGIVKTAVPAVSCGEDQYGTDNAFRRVVTRFVTVGLPGCS